jgi:ABC-2 type transport system permease protein
MSAVYKRELRAYMNNVYGYLFMSVMLLFVGVMMFYWNLGAGYANFEYSLLYGEYVLLLMIPILCMRSMAEDKRSRTDMFYLSLPLRTSSVVLGKYFALLTVYALPCGVICLYPLLLGAFGKVNYLSAYVAILTFFLLGAALIALCQFLSSLTDNLVVAAVLGVVAVVVLYFLPVLGSLYPDSSMGSFVGLVVLGVLVAGIAFLTTRNLTVTSVAGAAVLIPVSLLYIFLKDRFAGLLPAVLEFVSPFLHFQQVANYGLLSIPSLVLLLSYPVFFVFLTVQSADKKRSD